MDQPSYSGLGRHNLTNAVGGGDDRIAAVLRRSLLFEGLPHAVSVVTPASTVVRVARKRPLYVQDTTASAVFVVSSGRVRVSRASAERSLTVAYRSAGDVVGETAVLGDGVYHDAATATESVEAVAVPIEALRQLMAVEATIAERMLQIMVQRRIEAERRMEGLLVRSVESRVAGFLLDAAQRHGVPDSRGTLIGVKYTHQEIGDYVGSTRETVTLTLGELKRRGLVSFDHRRIVIENLDGLGRAAG